MRCVTRNVLIIAGVLWTFAPATFAQETWLLGTGRATFHSTEGKTSSATEQAKGAGENLIDVDDQTTRFEIDSSSVWLAAIDDQTVTHVAGQMRMHGSLLLISEQGSSPLDDWMIVPVRRDNPNEYLIVPTPAESGPAARITEVTHTFDSRANELVIAGVVVISTNRTSDSASAKRSRVGTIVLRLQMESLRANSDLTSNKLDAGPSPAYVKPAAATTESAAAASLIGPDIIVIRVAERQSYGSRLTCSQTGGVCTELADCNECSTTGTPCLQHDDCRVCSGQGVACQTPADCATCTNSALPCTTNNDCKTCTDDVNKSCVTHGDCNAGLCVSVQTCEIVEDCVVSGDACLISDETCSVSIAAFSIGTTSCNIGDTSANWTASTAGHPVIAQNLYRLKDDRFEQIGMSWVKHGFFSTNENDCGSCVTDPGQELGPGCSDPYSASLNGEQANLGPRSEVNAFTGEFAYPFAADDQVPTIGRRVQVHETDLDPLLNDGARYFAEGQYVTFDESTAGNGDNNASYREVAVEPPDEFNSQRYRLIDLPGGAATQVQQSAIEVWAQASPSVMLTEVVVPGEGKLLLGARATLMGNGMWSYEYALYNMNSDRSCGTFLVPLPDGAIVDETEIGFTDVDYHSGEPYSREDWTFTLTSNALGWDTEEFAVNPNANALRWGTMYNFRFVTNAEPAADALILIGLFKPGAPGAVPAITIGPMISLIDCDGNLIADECDISCDAPECSQPCGGSIDCNTNGVPDQCEADCNDNNIADECDIRDCPVGDLTCADCNNNTVPDGCAAELDCDGDGIPTNCDDDEDLDNDGIDDCLDLCPTTNPGLQCDCPARVICCFEGLPSQFCTPFDLQDCIDEPGGIPQCDFLNRCRDGCLVGDADNDGDLDLRDAANLQRCFDRKTDDPAGLVPPADECLRLFDFDQGGSVLLDDYKTFETGLGGPQ